MNAMPAKVAGVGEIVMVVPMPRAASAIALVLAAAALAGVDRVFAIGGAQAIGALAYGTATIPAVHKIIGPGNAYVASGQAARLRHGRHRHDRRPERDPRPRRRHDAARLGGDGSVQPGRARRAGAEHPALSRRGLHRPRGARRSSGCCRRCRARRRDPRLARRPRRAGPDALDGRSVRDREPDRARAPRGQRAPSRAAGSRCCATPARSSSAPSRARAWATTAPARTTCCRPSGTARFSSPLGVYDFQKRTQPDRGQRARRARRSGRSPPSWRAARGSTRMRAPPRCASKAGVATARRRDRLDRRAHRAR